MYFKNSVYIIFQIDIMCWNVCLIMWLSQLFTEIRFFLNVNNMFKKLTLFHYLLMLNFQLIIFLNKAFVFVQKFVIFSLFFKILISQLFTIQIQFFYGLQKCSIICFWVLNWKKRIALTMQSTEIVI